MTFPRVLSVAFTMALIFAATIGQAQQAASPVMPLLDAGHLRAQADAALVFGSGNTINVLGDPAKPGLYVIRRLFKRGEGTMPHFHNQDRFVTVIKGTWWTVEGDVVAPEKAVPIRPGGVMLHPAGLRHYDGARDEEVVVQIVGLGPVTTTQVQQASN
jgi:hypothetical protein